MTLESIEVSTEKAVTDHIEKIESAIDSILDLERYYSQMPPELTSALNRLNNLRSLAEEEIDKGDWVYDTYTGKERQVSRVGERNLFFEDDNKDHSMIGRKFCFKRHY